MQKTVQNFLSKAIGKSIWGTRRRVGSTLVFEIGNKIENDRGEFHFWVNCGHWWLQQGKEIDFQDLLHSESSKANIDQKITILDEKKLLHVQLDNETNSISIDFTDDIFLRIAPYGGNKIQDMLLIFSAEKILKVLSNGQVVTKPVD